MKVHRRQLEVGGGCSFISGDCASGRKRSLTTRKQEEVENLFAVWRDEILTAHRILILIRGTRVKARAQYRS
jgi:hypothetical protein